MKTRSIAWLLPCLIVLIMPTTASADNSEIQQLKDQIRLLSQKVEALEKKQIAAAQPTATSTMQAEAVTHAANTTSTATAENSGNPSISVIGTFAGSSMRSGATHTSNFLPMSEGEFVFGAEVDAHTRLDVTVTAANGAMAAEEAYLTARLPQGVNMRVGRKFIPLGRANGVHPHALPYIDIPNGLVNLFGPDKFIGEGVYIDRPFYVGDSAQSLMLGFYQTANAVAFDPTGANRYAGIGRWTGLWDLNDTTTMELGSTYVNGHNGIAAGSRSELLGAHLAIKNLQFDHSGWAVEGEWNRNRMSNGAALAKTNTDGAYLLASYAFNRNWHLFGRFDHSRISALPVEHDYTGGIGWDISEFQGLTLQMKHSGNLLPQTAGALGLTAGQRANEILFRWVVAIGPHGAHSY